MSTDDSVEIAKRLLKKPHKIVELKQKRLNGGARNEGYLYLSNDVDYVWYVDSDDWVLDDDVLNKINQALKYKPDVLFVGMSDFYRGKLRPCYIPQYKDKYEAMKGWSGSCGKVIKKELATRQDCLYNEGTLKEDRNQHFKICFHMNDFDILKEPIYVWNRSNTKSVTTIREKIKWGTSTIRHYADAKELYLTYKGQDEYFDKIMEERLQKCREEILSGGDRQY